MQQAVFIGFPTTGEYFGFRRCPGPSALLREVFLGQAILCDDFHTGTSFRKTLGLSTRRGKRGAQLPKKEKEPAQSARLDQMDAASGPVNPYDA